MVFYSTKSREKVFHLSHCNIRRRMNKEYEQQYETPEEARAHGYRMCNRCSPLGVRFRKEQPSLTFFCQEHSIECHLEDGQLLVQAPDSQWRVIVNGRGNKLFLYHKNSYNKPEKIPSIVPGYHSQATRSKTILGYLEYIVQHDAYRERERELNKKKQHAYRNLRQNTQKFKKGRGNARVSANQLYSILDDVYF